MTAVLILVSLKLLLLTATRATKNDAHCITFGLHKNEMGIDVPFVYNGAPKPLGNIYIKEENTTANQVLAKLCPEFAVGPNPAVCCNLEYLIDFRNKMQIVETVGFSRCPSCLYNLNSYVCNIVCSPYQSKFLRVNESKMMEDGTEVATSMVYLISKKFVYRMYDSCKGVQGLFPGTMVMDYGLCGRWGSKYCSPERWVDYMAMSKEDGGHADVKFHIILSMYKTVELNGETFEPMNSFSARCSESAGPGYEVCGCNDCEEACSVDLLPPTLPDKVKPFTILRHDGVVMVSGLVFIFLATVISVVFYSKKYQNNSKIKIIFLKMKVDQRISLNCIQLFGDIGMKFEMMMQSLFSKWAKIVTLHPFLIIFISLLTSAVLVSGLSFGFKLTTNPVHLWVSEYSLARKHMEYFNAHFGPFYRIEQIIITPTNNESFTTTIEVQQEYLNVTWSSVFRKDFLLSVFDLQRRIENLKSKNSNGTDVYFKDICFAPLSPLNDECAIQSIFGFFQNNRQSLENHSGYLSHVYSCSINPREQRCFTQYGGPIDSTEVVLGGFEDTKYETARALVITLPVINHNDDEKNNNAMIWEKEFIKFMKEFKNPLMNVMYKVERSVEDELERGSHSDIFIIFLSYVAMFCYVAVALGDFVSFRRILVDSKLGLGLAGISIVLISVVSCFGVFCYFGISSTPIVLQVVPFLVLAVGIDNIFLLVKAFQRDERDNKETLEDQVSRVFGRIAPSMLLSSVSVSSCFFIGALTEMPVVKTFALYAGVALVTNFILQMTLFLALFTLDARRKESKRLDICCCVQISERSQRKNNEGMIHKFFTNYYSSFLMKDCVRYFTVLTFVGWLCSSFAVLDKVHVGLNLDQPLPEDSYLIEYLSSVNQYLAVGHPLYFVITDGYNYSDLEAQNKICSTLPSCDADSFMMQLGWMAKLKNSSYVAFQPIGWLDSYFEFLRSELCCFEYRNNMSFCPSQIGVTQRGLCRSCSVLHPSQLSSEEFMRRALFFLQDIPWEKCSKSGKAVFGSSVEIVRNESNPKIGATSFMTYHTVLKTSDDFTEALRWARKISVNLTRKLSSQNSKVEVFPYSPLHVFFEQYLWMWRNTIRNLSFSIGAAFLATFLLLGLDLHSAFMMLITVTMIIINLMGLMYWWNISLNAISLVNLVVSVGISIEFCSHITRAFALSTKPTRVLRAQDAVCKVGSSVLSGVTLTDCGVLALAFAKSRIFVVYYFRMYCGIIMFGTLHGLVFLPVFLSIAGPPIRKSFIEKSRNGEYIKIEQKITVI